MHHSPTDMGVNVLCCEELFLALKDTSIALASTRQMLVVASSSSPLPTVLGCHKQKFMDMVNISLKCKTACEWSHCLTQLGVRYMYIHMYITYYSVHHVTLQLASLGIKMNCSLSW